MKPVHPARAKLIMAIKGYVEGSLNHCLVVALLPATAIVLCMRTAELNGGKRQKVRPRTSDVTEHAFLLLILSPKRYARLFPRSRSKGH